MPARPRLGDAGSGPARQAPAHGPEPPPLRTCRKPSSWRAARRRRRDRLDAYELEAEVADAVEEAEQLSLVRDLADEGGLAASALESHAFERRREPLGQAPSHGDAVGPGR